MIPYEFVPVVIGVVFIFGLIGFGLVRKALADKERLQLREMVHRERMTAMEKDLPVEDLRLEDTRRGRQRIDGRVDALLGDATLEHDERVEVAERRGRRGVGEVVGRHVDRLHRGDRARGGRGDLAAGSAAG